MEAGGGRREGLWVRRAGPADDIKARRSWAGLRGEAGWRAGGPADELKRAEATEVAGEAG